MRNRYLLPISLAVAVSVFLVIRPDASRPKVVEPTLNGKRLHDWVRIIRVSEYSDHIDDDFSERRLSDATSAVRAIGTNAVPYLVHTLQNDDPFWWRPYNWVQSQIQSFTDLELPFLWDGGRRDDAILACRVIGPNARGVAPALLKRFNRRPSFELACALAAIGGEAAKSVLNQATNVVTLRSIDFTFPIHLIRAFRYSPASEMGRVAPVLNTALRSLDTALQEDATLALYGLKTDVQLFLPALMANVQSADSSLCTTTISRLGDFGSKARESLPLLRQKLTDNNSSVREAAAFAIRQIDPRGARQPATTNQPPVSR